MKNPNPEVSKFFSEIAKRVHKQKPRPKEFYQAMNKKSLEVRRAKRAVDKSS